MLNTILSNLLPSAATPKANLIPMYESLEERRDAADRIIMSHTAWAAGAGLIPFFGVDMLAVSALQLDMLRRLAEIYGVDFELNKGRATIATLIGGGTARFGARLFKWIPIVGTLIGGVTMSVLSGTTTYACGQVFKKHFEGGGNFLDLNFSKAKDVYERAYERGKNIVEGMENKTATPSAAKNTPSATPELSMIDKLEKLREMRQNDIINEADYQRLKNKLMDTVD